MNMNMIHILVPQDKGENMKKVFIIDAKRSAIGSMLGTLKEVEAGWLGAQIVKAIIKDNNLDPAAINEVILGNVLGAGTGQAMARQVSIGAGIPVEVPAYTVNMVCGSGMKAVMNAALEISVGQADIIIAGGTEVMSAAPFLVNSRVRTGNKMGDMKLQDHMLLDGLIDSFSKVHMGITAENIAEKYGITREEQDAFAMNSQRKAIKAQDEGKFKDEIVPLTVKAGKSEVVFDNDEYINRNTSPEKLAKLRPCFKADGTVTAGSSSGINDGASFILLASEDAVNKYGFKPMAEVIAYGQGGVDPQIMGMGPVPAIINALKMADMDLKDMDIVELNEAFAAQSLGVITALCEHYGIGKEDLMAKCNVNGGAIALGHPLGASGNRITVTLVHEMKRSGKKYGVASLCIGGGMGTAIVLKNIM